MSLDMDLSFQGSLFGSGRPAFDATFGGVERRWLDPTSWIDHAACWLGGADDLIGELIDLLPWRQREVTMWERRLPEPRLTHWWDGAEASRPLPILAEIQDAMTAHFGRCFDSIGYNLYRDGR